MYWNDAAVFPWA